MLVSHECCAGSIWGYPDTGLPPAHPRVETSARSVSGDSLSTVLCIVRRKIGIGVVQVSVTNRHVSQHLKSKVNQPGADSGKDNQRECAELDQKYLINIICIVWPGLPCSWRRIRCIQDAMIPELSPVLFCPAHIRMYVQVPPEESSLHRCDGKQLMLQRSVWTSLGR